MSPTQPSALVADFFTKYPLKTYTHGDHMVMAEEEFPGIFYLLSGRVDKYDITSTGNQVVVNSYKPYAFFPMSYALNHLPNHYFFVAGTDVAARLAPSNEVVAFLEENPPVVLDLLSRVYRGTDGLLRRMAHLMGGDVKSRLLFELLNTGYRFGVVQPDGGTIVALTESDIGQRAGLARESVSRALRELKKAGLVSVTSSGILIPDMRALEEVLGEEV